MNEIISALQQCQVKAEVLQGAVKRHSLRSDALDYRAVYEMACGHLDDTLHLFKHARKLKNELEAERKPKHPPGGFGGPGLPNTGGEWPKPKKDGEKEGSV